MNEVLVLFCCGVLCLCFGCCCWVYWLYGCFGVVVIMERFLLFLLGFLFCFWVVGGRFYMVGSLFRIVQYCDLFVICKVVVAGLCVVDTCLCLGQ